MQQYRDLLERLEFNGIDTAALKQPWDAYYQLHRQHSHIEAPDKFELQRRRAALEVLKDPEDLRRAVVMIEKVAARNAHLKAEKQRLVKACEKARVEAVRATRGLLIGIFDSCAREIGKIAESNALCCQNYPVLLPERMVDLHRRGVKVAQLLSTPALSVDESDRTRLTVHLLGYVPAHLRNGVRARCQRAA
jgi:hypothetical protein